MDKAQTPLTLRHASLPDDRALLDEIFWEYLEWAGGRLREEYNIDIGVAALHQESMEHLEIFFPPDGRVVLVEDQQGVLAVSCMKRLDREVGEIKRMYVRERGRRKGAGRLMLTQLLQDGRELGLEVMKLDSARFMKQAHALYRSEGFQDIPPYPGSEIPLPFQAHWLFMEKPL